MAVPVGPGTASAAALAAAVEDGTLVAVVPDDRAGAGAGAGAGGEGRDLVLDGLTVAVKDNVDVAGVPTTAGCPAYAYVPERSAPVVDRLAAAGAVVVAKANLDQFATGLVGVRTPGPAPANPLAPELVPGGSSSGSAVAVARGLVDVGVGTDTAGSGRVPAALTGTVGWKPAPGRVPTEGLVPACWSLDCPSLFTADVATAVRAGAVLDPDRPWRPVAPTVVGVPDAAALADVDPGVLAGLGAVVERLQAHAGGTWSVPEVDLAPMFAVGDLLYSGPWLAERTAAIGDFLAAHPDDVHPVVREVVLAGGRWSATDAYRALHTRHTLASGPVAALWRGVDVLVVPTVPWLPTVDEVHRDPTGTNRRLGRFTHFGNLLGLAALAVPVPDAPRSHPAVPLGVTLLCPPGREGMLVAVAAALGAPGAAELVGPDVEVGPAELDGVGTGSRVEVAVVGAHLSGMPLNDQLTDPGGVLVERTTTAPTYRLHRLPGGSVPRPALERVPTGGVAVEVEVWSLPLSALGPFTASVGRPLAIGTVALADGRDVVGFVCEQGGLAGATDISAAGGWRAHLATTG